MTIDPEFLELMPTDIVIERFTGVDGFGNNTYATSETRKGRVEGKSATMNVSTVPGGTMLAAIGNTVLVYVDYVAPRVPTKSKVTVEGVPYTVLTETVEYDENGPYYQTLTCENNQEG